jgi:putative ABC transport system ATP-binding protein
MIIEARDLTRHYPGVAALDGLTLEVARGEYVAVQGPSGSGKSTLLNLLAGLDRPTSGTLRVCGQDLLALGPSALNVFRRENIGLIFQQHHLIPYLTALENVMLAQYYHSMVDVAEARAALAAVGLEERCGHLPYQLSGGEQQRVCVARALINDPPLLLADEPTGNLDRHNRDRLLELFAELRGRGKTLVVVTHDPYVAAQASRRIYLDHGRLGAPPAELEVHDRVHDDLLKELMILAEEGRPTREELLGRVPGASAADLEYLVQGRRVLADGPHLNLGEAALERARFLVRRHRLAEVMLVSELGFSPEEVEPHACALEHSLDARQTDMLCRRLSHPSRCPHGNPIPRGECCPAG